MKNNINSVSLVIPVYNEAESINSLYRQLKETLIALKLKWEMIFVDDGSTDSSLSIIKKLKENDANIKFVKLRKNYGKSAALSAGFEFAQNDLIITLDADLQDLPQEIPNFINKINEGWDLLSGWRHERQDPLFKKLSSKLFNWVTARCTGLKLHDFNCGFKAYRKEVIKSLNIYGELYRYLPVLVNWQGFRVGELKVAHQERALGKTKYGPGKLISGFFDLFTVLMITRYGKKPLHLFGGIGVALMLLGLVILSYLSILWFSGTGIGQRPLLQLGVLLEIFGIQLFSIGLLGEMIANIRRKEDYSIEQKEN